MSNIDFAAEIAEGRRQAATLPDTASCVTDAMLTERIADWTEALAGATVASQAGHAAFSLQRNQDIAHARATGQCDGCTKTSDSAVADGTWAHRPTCVTPRGSKLRWTIAQGVEGTEVIVLG